MNKKMREILAVITCICMISVFGVMAMANNGEEVTAVPINAPVEAPAVTSSVCANVVVVEAATPDVPFILVETTTEPITQIKLNMTFGLVLDTQTGELMDLTELKAGDKVVAYYSEAMTRSMPPIANCEAIVANIGDKHAPATMLGVGQITANEDGTVKFLSTDGGYMITIAADAEVSFASGKTVEDINEIAGHKVFVWFDIAAMSYPAQAQTDRVVVINPIAAPAAPSFEIDLSENNVFENGSNVMIPIRKVFEALGFTVTWNGDDCSVNLSNDDVDAFIFIGDNTCQMTGDDPATELVLDAAPVIVDGSTYAPTQLLDTLMGNGYASAFTEGVLTVSAPGLF